jgi:type I restriction enzyme M protein
MKPQRQLLYPLIRKELVAPHTLMGVFNDIRNTLAGSSSGTTLDQSLVNQLVDVLACKIYDEIETQESEPVRFQRIPGETVGDVAKKIDDLFRDVKRNSDLSRLFSDESLSLDSEMLVYVVEKLQSLDLTNANRDAIGEAFEVFIGPSIRGSEGQFFTPRNVVDLACQVINPKDGEVVLDPACGTGGFLLQALRCSPRGSHPRVIGVDKDEFLARVAAIQLVLASRSPHSPVFCSDSLNTRTWPADLNRVLQPGSVDVVITNPPFGAKISVRREVLETFTLARKWSRDRTAERWHMQDAVVENRPPQILFLEHCINMLRPGGRAAIVVPDGILGNENQGFVRQYIRNVADVVAIIDLPLETFMPSTSTKTSLLVLRKQNSMTQNRVFMAIPQHCGHDRRGKTLRTDDGQLKDDLPKIALNFREWSADHANDF